jgi:LCP family protein required for cell wall assembly
MRQEPVNLLRAAEKPALEPVEKRPLQLGRILLYCILTLVLTTGVTFGINYYNRSHQTDPAPTGGKTLQPKQFSFLEKIKTFFFGPDQILKGEEKDRINILLLGMGGAGHDGPYLSDTNIIASIKPSTNEVAMISIPRDLGVKIPNYGFRKINHVNAFAEQEHPGEGGEYTRQFFSENFNISIDYYVRVNFKAFEELVDLVGGVTVDVPKDFTDYTFPGPNNSYRVVSFKAGEQTLNGEWALIYSRSRHGGNGEGSDFARARRQQQVLTALKDKLLSFGTYTNPLTVKKMIDSLAANVQTNMEIPEIMSLATIAKDINSNFKTLVIDDSPNGYLVPSSQATYVPRGGSFAAINTAIETIFNPTSTIPALGTIPSNTNNKPVFSQAHIEIQNGTWHAGFASRIKKRLQDIGLSVNTVGNSLKRPIDTTTIYVLKPLPDDILSLLSKELKASTTTTLPTWMMNSTSTDGQKPFQPDSEVVIILGNDLQNQFTLN